MPNKNAYSIAYIMVSMKDQKIIHRPDSCDQKRERFRRDVAIITEATAFKAHIQWG